MNLFHELPCNPTQVQIALADRLQDKARGTNFPPSRVWRVKGRVPCYHTPGQHKARTAIQHAEMYFLFVLSSLNHSQPEPAVGRPCQYKALAILDSII